MTQVTQYAAPLARLLLSFMFILSGFRKISGYAGTQQYMEAMGVPGELLSLVILVEVAGGIALLVGWQARTVAFLLAGFSVLTGVIFHLVPSFGMEGMDARNAVLHFQKNMAIAGGMLMVVALGPGRFSLSARDSNAPVSH